MIVIGGMIGLGKTTIAKVLRDAFHSEVFFEEVDKNPILPLFYTATPAEIEAKRYPFLLQLFFLNSRFAALKRALLKENNIIDRSIYEDWYFAKVNHDLGRINDMEFSIYQGLFHNMVDDLQDLPKKAPDLMVYLHASFETVLKRIKKRNRPYEQDPSLIEYYRLLWEGYDAWVKNHYKASAVFFIDMDKYDVVAHPEHKQILVDQIKEKLKELGFHYPI